MGVFSVKYRLNDKEMISAVAGNYGISEAEMEALLELLVMDGVHSGAIDAGEDHRLSDADREYMWAAWRRYICAMCRRLHRTMCRERAVQDEAVIRRRLC